MPEISTITVSLRTELNQKLDALAESTQRSKSWLVSEAIAAYVKQQEWQIEQIEKALDEADKPEAQWIEHEQISLWLQTWRDDNGCERPCP